MANRAVDAERLQWCLQQLIDGRPTHRLVADLATREDISRRQSRRIVGKAYSELAADIDESAISGPQYLARMIANTETAIEIAINAKHANGVVGGVNTLSRLLGIGYDYRVGTHHHPVGRRWS